MCGIGIGGQRRFFVALLLLLNPQRSPCSSSRPSGPSRTPRRPGCRTTALLRAFARAGYSLAVGASAARNAASEALERGGGSFSRTAPVACFSVPLNRSSALDAALSSCNPTVVVFDRFTSEEAFSWRVREKAPEAARVLDMQDWHSLRRARARAVELADERKSSSSSTPKQNPVSAALEARIDASDKDAVREASAIYRSDLTLVCSPVEEEAPAAVAAAGGSRRQRRRRSKTRAGAAVCLEARAEQHEEEALRAEAALCCYWFFLARSERRLAALARREEAVGQEAKKKKKRKEKENENDTEDDETLSTPIWDLIASKPGMEDAELHIYGSYAPKCAAAAEIHDPKRGVFVHGPAPNLSPLSRARVLLAPLRFGAGLKGRCLTLG